MDTSDGEFLRPISAAPNRELAMQNQHNKPRAFLFSTCAAVACTAPALAADPVMISRFARDTGLPPAEVVLTLGENIGLVEAQYNARPSSRGHLARLTGEAHDRQMAERLPDSGHSLAGLLPPDR